MLSLALLATATVAATSGCSWFHKGARGDYALAPEARPLEVPPDLNLPDTSGAMKVPTLASTTQQQTNTPPSASANSGFTVPGERDEVFGKVGAALADIPGLTIASKAQMLGSYDVSYEVPASWCAWSRSTPAVTCRPWTHVACRRRRQRRWR